MEIFYSNDIEGAYLRLNEEESAHCVRVLRHRTGDEIAVMDGKGNLLWCTLTDASPKAAVAKIERRQEGFGTHPYRLTLAVCPTKNNERYEWMAEKATEIGVDTIVPVIGDRSERKVFKTERLKRLVLSAAKQSLKGAVPQVEEPVSVKAFIETAPGAALKLIAYCFEGDKLSIKAALEASDAEDVIVLIGPEGDFAPAEVESAIKAGFKPVHLGDSRLRTETAAIASAMALYLKYMQ